MNFFDDTRARGRNRGNSFFVFQFNDGLILCDRVAFLDEDIDHDARIRTLTQLGKFDIHKITGRQVDANRRRFPVINSGGSKLLQTFRQMWHLISVRRIVFFFALCCCLAAMTARAAHTHVQLLLSADTTKPGDTIWAGVDMKMDAGWHTYWKNPGDSGIPTTIKWDLPPGVTAGEIQWPLPEKLPPAEITTYGYEKEVMLLVPLTLATNLAPGPLVLKADVAWLECMEQCVPGGASVEATLNIGGETKTSADAAMIESWKKQVPQTNTVYWLKAWWEKPSSGDTRPLILQGSQISEQYIPIDYFDFFPNADNNFEVQPATEEISKSSGFNIRKVVKKFSGDWPKEISGVLVVQQKNSRTGYELKLPISDQILARLTDFAQTARQSGTGFQPVLAGKMPAPLLQPIWQMLLYAFIGGLILNLMPCVLPVIALKILGFVSEAKSEPHRVRKLGLIYAFGVLLSFLVLAAVVVGVKAAGHHAGWGMQFGSPIFIVCLTTLVTLVALNLFGVFEVTFGGRALDAAGTSPPGTARRAHFLTACWRPFWRRPAPRRFWAPHSASPLPKAHPSSC